MRLEVAVYKAAGTKGKRWHLWSRDPDFSAVLDVQTLNRMAGGVDIESGDELVLDVSLVRRTRPERTT